MEVMEIQLAYDAWIRQLGWCVHVQNMTSQVGPTILGH